MAPLKQSGKQSRGKDLLIDDGEEVHSKLVSEQGDRGANSLSNFEELAHIRKVQDHLLSTFANISAKCDLLLHSRMENVGNRGNLDSREGIGTSHVRVSANGVVVNDDLQGTRHDFNVEEQTMSFGGRHQQGVPRFGMKRDCQEEEQLLSSGRRQHREEYVQGIHHHHQQEEPWLSFGNRQYSLFRWGRDSVQQNV